MVTAATTASKEIATLLEKYKKDDIIIFKNYNLAILQKSWEKQAEFINVFDQLVCEGYILASTEPHPEKLNTGHDTLFYFQRFLGQCCKNE